MPPNTSRLGCSQAATPAVSEAFIAFRQAASGSSGCKMQGKDNWARHAMLATAKCLHHATNLGQREPGE